MQIDPEFSAIVFGGMIERVRTEASLIDWKQLITTAAVTGITTVGLAYMAVRDSLADHQTQIAEIKVLIQSRMLQREAQIAAITERDERMAAAIVALQTEDMRVRQDMLICRETIAEIKARNER
jgi:hypothetical protein